MGKRRRNGRKGSHGNGSAEEPGTHVGSDEVVPPEEGPDEPIGSDPAEASDAKREDRTAAPANPSGDLKDDHANSDDSGDPELDGEDVDSDLPEPDFEETDHEEDESEETRFEDEPGESADGEEGQVTGEVDEGGTPSGAATATDPTRPTGSSASQEPTGDAKTEKLSQISPEFFGLARRMSLDEVVELVDNTDRESDALTKGTGRVLSVQSAMDPELLTKLKDRKDRKTHIGTIRKWKLAGDAFKELEEAGMSAEGLTTYQLHAISRAPSRGERLGIAKDAIEQSLSVRDIDKKVSPLVKRAKMEATGELIDLSDQAVGIMEGLDDPQKLMQDPDISMILQDPNRLKAELSFSELSTIHEKAKKVEKKTEKQKRALEEKAAKFMPAIAFLRVIRESISRAFEG